MSKTAQDGRVFSVAAHKLAISHLPCDLTDQGIRNLLPPSVQRHLIDIRLVQVYGSCASSLKFPGFSQLVYQGKKESKGLNAAFLTLTSASAKEEVMTKLHEKPPLNLVVTSVASWKDRLGGEKEEMGELEEDENNNLFVFGSPLVLDVPGDEVIKYFRYNLGMILGCRYLHAEDVVG